MSKGENELFDCWQVLVASRLCIDLNIVIIVVSCGADYEQFQVTNTLNKFSFV